MPPSAPLFDWDNLLTELQNQRVIPIVGGELLNISLGEGRCCSLDRYVADALIAKFNFKVSRLPRDYTLNDVAWHYLLEEPGAKRPILYNSIRKILQERSFPTPQPLCQLAEISDFTLFVSTTFDPLLEEALNAKRFQGQKGTRCHAYSLQNNKKFDSNELDDLETDPFSVKQSTVFHLMGWTTSPGDFVVTDEDALEFLYSLQEGGKGRPVNLFDRLRQSNLLLLGCNYPDWLTRFFLRTISGNRMTEDSSRIEYVADRRTPTDSILGKFLRNIKVTVFDGSSAIDFVDELHRRWSRQRAQEEDAGLAAASDLTSSGPVEPAPPVTVPGSVFLSYASEDRTEVLALKKGLEAEGIRVWYDQKALETGEEYDSAIKANIERCTLFFPCISQKALKEIKRPGRRYFQEEWNAARQEEDWRSYPFIWPIVLDDTPADDRFIPSYLRKLQMERCPAGKAPVDFLEHLKVKLAQFEGERGDSQ
ncbi:MAG: hypothetical protein A2075_16695 [Geobacteraceae bacterium GWC2_58_44]|nr:MAG: hypothetical protein A2075_16695 [Geobacteraceae bacterium GWC2_58_44]HBG06764.1 hypothetical protein [Geobacter sp.]